MSDCFTPWWDTTSDPLGDVRRFMQASEREFYLPLYEATTNEHHDHDHFEQLRNQDMRFNVTFRTNSKMKFKKTGTLTLSLSSAGGGASMNITRSVTLPEDIVLDPDKTYVLKERPGSKNFEILEVGHAPQ